MFDLWYTASLQKKSSETNFYYNVNKTMCQEVVF